MNKKQKDLVQMHKQLNEAFAILLNLAIEVNLRGVYASLIELRGFMSRVIDHEL
ncbi:MAG: hypothetical protein WC503_04030 [Candidatus Shapirobacteria bacterium]